MKRSILWIALILTGVITFVWPMIPVASAEHRLMALPSSSPDFQSRPVELSAADQTLVGAARATQNLICMRGGGQLLLTVIDGTRNRHAVHDPIYCFSGAGWKVQAKNNVKLNSGEATWVSLANQGHTSEALWFFDDGKRQFTSPMDYWSATSRRRLTLELSGDEPVLVTLRSLPDEPVNWDRLRQILLPALGFHSLTR